jgi:hypothetical protein
VGGACGVCLPSLPGRTSLFFSVLRDLPKPVVVVCEKRVSRRTPFGTAMDAYLGLLPCGPRDFVLEIFRAGGLALVADSIWASRFCPRDFDFVLEILRAGGLALVAGSIWASGFCPRDLVLEIFEGGLALVADSIWAVSDISRGPNHSYGIQFSRPISSVCSLG